MLPCEIKHQDPGCRRGERTRHPMAKVIEIKTDGNEEGLAPTLDEIAREGARRMLLEALDLEVADCIARHQERDEEGHAKNHAGVRK